ncbi:MAG: PAS domain S-box protein [Polyangiaceae bacterium]|nr:PAS domain S-box protein [Polyangiaceae bacterium]
MRPDGERRTVSTATRVRALRGLHLTVFRDVTGRRAAELALRCSEERFAKAFRAGPVASCIVTEVEGRVVEANDAFLALTGHERAEAVGRTCSELGLWVDPSERARLDAAVAERGSARQVPVRVRRRSGALRATLLSAERIEGAGESCVLTVFEDVTERDGALDALRREQARLRALLEDSADAIVLVDASGVMTYVSPSIRNVLGRTPEQVVGGHALGRIHPDDLPAARAALGRVLAAPGGRVRLECRGLHADGSWIDLEVIAANHLDDPDVASIVGNFRDITERRRGERARDLLASIVESSDDAIISASPDGRFLSWNAAAERLYGYRAEEVVGHDLRIIDAVSTPGDARELLLRAAAGERVVHHETRRRRRDGVEIDVSVTVSPVRDASGRVVGGSAIVRDVSERRRAEVERARLTADLQRELEDREKAERALRRREEELRQVQKMEAVGSLAGGLAHDFNNLLSVIMSYAEIVLAELAPGEPYHTEISAIHGAGMRAGELTRQLLAFSRRQILQPRVVDANELCAGLARILRRLVGEHVELVLAPAADLGRVLIDPSQLENVMLNLASNARDAMPRGGQLLISTQNASLDADAAAARGAVRPGRYVCISVRDTGVGMDEATRERMFEPFFTTKGLGHGTGLGLATVFGVVQQSAGHLVVDSAPGEGTTVGIWLPRTDEPPEAPPSGPVPSDRLRGVETILLVEDDSGVREVVRHILRRQGYQVLEAANAGEALLICEQHTSEIHLMLTDVVMPRMSGRSLAARLAPLRPHMKVLYMSGYTHGGIDQQGVLDPGITFIPKPIRPEALARRVRALLDQ